MRRDTQIGIILGVAILVIIGVFLSTRTSVKLQEPSMSEGDMSEIEEIDVSDLARGPKGETTENTVSEEESLRETLLDASSEDDNYIEGQWGGVGTDVAKDDENDENYPDTNTKNEFKELLATIQNLSDEEGEEQQHETTSVDFSKEITHKVKLNDSLSRIAQEYYGDESKWREIYKANKDIIQNPNTLRLGLVLQIPDIKFSARKTGGEERHEIIFEAKSTSKGLTGETIHKVRAGDTLYKLAEKYYGNPNVWRKIYNANEDTLENTNMLKIGQEIIIPE